MFSFLKSNPEKKLKRQIQDLSLKAVNFQRNGKLREYAEVTAEIQDLEKKLDTISSEEPKF